MDARAGDVPRLRREHGVLGVERDGTLAFARWRPAATFRDLPTRIDDWKGQVHVVERAAVPDADRAALDLIWPLEVTPPTQPLDRAMLSATALTVVSAEVREALIARDVRVWTVGYHRTCGVLRIAAAGGGAPICIAHSSYAGGPVTRPIGRPTPVPWYELLDRDRIDRILRGASGGVLDEASILLADAIDRDGWNLTSGPADERRRMRDAIALVLEDEAAARDGYYEDLRWGHAHYFGTIEPTAPAAAQHAAVAAIAAPDGPRELEVAGIGCFWRERLPAQAYELGGHAGTDGWLAPLSHLDGAVRPDGIHLPDTHRYVREMPSGPWWEI